MHEAVYQTGNPRWHAEFLPGVGDSELDRIEQQLGRRLPEEARTLYAWHDGANTSFAPLVSFSALRVAFKTATAIAKFPLPPVSNEPAIISPGTLFPVFNIERVLFNVLTAAPPTPRAKSSGVYVLDFERNYLTLLALSIRDFIDNLIAQLEIGNAIYTEHGLHWKKDPFGFHPSMRPLGADDHRSNEGANDG